MPGIDDKRPFVPLKIAVLTVSDTRELPEDKSGATLAERIEKAGHAVAARAIVTDDVENIREQVRAWIADNPQGKFGHHEYKLAQYGIEPAELREQFGRYLARYNVEPEGL